VDRAVPCPPVETGSSSGELDVTRLGADAAYDFSVAPRYGGKLRTRLILLFPRVKIKRGESKLSPRIMMQELEVEDYRLR
jgi:hypothetical protein